MKMIFLWKFGWNPFNNVGRVRDRRVFLCICINCIQDLWKMGQIQPKMIESKNLNNTCIWQILWEIFEELQKELFTQAARKHLPM